MSKLLPVVVKKPADLSADHIVAGCFEGFATTLEGADDGLRSALDELQKASDWHAKKNQSRQQAIGRGRRVEIRGLGDPNDFSHTDAEKWLQSTVDASARGGARKLGLVLPSHSALSGDAAALRVLRQLALARYRFDSFKHRPTESSLSTIHLLPPPGEEAAYRSQTRAARAITRGTMVARDLGNTPPNIATPDWMAKRAAALAKKHGMTAQILGVRELEKRRMGGILAVGQGSANSARLVRLEWGHRGPTVALVGKGVTFDTGGISIKPARDLDEMKYDKCGACTAIGVAVAAAEAKLPLRLRVYLPLVENMPDGRAYRPGDIVRCYNGKTVEILNTDAEGRMILADALSWAVEEKPDWLLEYSTLTGAAVVALGDFAAALYSPSDELAGALLESAEAARERLWRMPLWPEYVEQIKGHHGDLRNIGGRWGGASTAAAFLSQFVDDHPRWAHLDIAGPAMASEPKGATGYGIAFTFGWLRQLREGPAAS